VGQKIHPIGFRLGISRDFYTRWYARKQNMSSWIKEDLEIRQFLNKRLRNAAVSSILIERAADRVSVNILSGRPGVVIGKGGKGVDELRESVQKRFAKPIQLNVSEVRSPELDAKLVAESIAQQIERRIAPKRAMRQAVQRTMRAGAKGIKVMTAGRLGGSEMARREIHKDGKIPLHTLRADIDYGLHEARTQYGNIGVKVWIYRGDVIAGDYLRSSDLGMGTRSQPSGDRPAAAPRGERKSERPRRRVTKNDAPAKES
jgi:small subunit ribosomal protein S3